MTCSAGDPEGSTAFRRLAGIQAVIALPLAFASNLLGTRTARAVNESAASYPLGISLASVGAAAR
jgi:hypothetical protein